MKLSTKSTYGLRAMMNIALKSPGGATSITEIAQTEGISAAYLEQLLNTLRHKGLVKSVRGPKGGYLLSRKSDAITVADIVKCLESDIAPRHCVTVHGRARNTCKRSSACVPQIVWMKLANSINDCLESITLRDLCKETKKH